jgi:feruloyl esterase
MKARSWFGLAVAAALAVGAWVAGLAAQGAQPGASSRVSSANPPIECTALTGRTFENGTSIVEAALVTSGTIPISDTTAAKNLPRLCRVQGVSKPSGDSDIRFEVWLPQPDAWNRNRGAAFS